MEFLRQFNKKKITGLAVLLIIIPLFFVRNCGKVSSNLHQLLKSDNSYNVSKTISVNNLNNKIIILNFADYENSEYLGQLGKIQNLYEDHNDILVLVDIIKPEKSADYYISKFSITNPVVAESYSKIKDDFNLNKETKLAICSTDGKIKREYKEYLEFESIAKDFFEISTKFTKSLNSNPLPICDGEKKCKEKEKERNLNFPTNILYVEYSKAYRNKPLLIISDSGNNKVIISSITGKIFDKIDGNDSREENMFNLPQGLFYRNENLYISDSLNNSIKKFDLENKKIEVILSKKDGIYYPTKIVQDPQNKDSILILNSGKNNILSYNLKSGLIKQVHEFNSKEIVDLDYFNGEVYYISTKTNTLEKLYSNDIDDKHTREEGGEFLTAEIPQGVNGIYKDDTGTYIISGNMIYKLKDNVIKLYTGKFKSEDSEQTLDNLIDEEVYSIKSVSYDNPNDLIGVKDRFYIVDTNNNRIVILNRNTEEVEVLELRV
ncbi:hypothetical protein ACFL0U_02395 [Pseudomonadota bacterium]